MKKNGAKFRIASFVLMNSIFQTQAPNKRSLLALNQTCQTGKKDVCPNPGIFGS
jgi:hypothetical protein